MAENEFRASAYDGADDGDWGGENLPLWIRERIRDVEVNSERLLSSVAQLRSAVIGYAAGSRINAEVGAHV